MSKDMIRVPEKGTYEWHQFVQWSNEFRQTHADHVAYIALHLAGALDACRVKLDTLVQRHSQQARDARNAHRHNRALERLRNTMTGAAIAYESSCRCQ